MRRLELIFWSLIPPCIILALALFTLLPKHMFGLSYFMPPLVMIPLFFFGLLQPRDVPYSLVFALGLVMDAVQGLPLGFSSLQYLLLLILLGEQSKYIIKEGFAVKWCYFAVLLLAVSFAGWVLLGLLQSQMQPLMPLLVQCLLTLCFYPLLHHAFDLLHEQSKHRRRQIAHGR